MTRLLLASLLVLGVPLLASCEREKSGADQVEEETRELGEALQSYTAEQRDEALRRAREGLAELDDRIEQLEERVQDRWTDMDQLTREKAENQLQALEAQRAKAADWYDRLAASSTEAWVRMREGFAEALSAFRETWREAEKDLDSDR